MRFLLMDTVSASPSVALLDGKDLRVRPLGQGRGQSAEVFPALEELLGERRLEGLGLAIALSGPGSFTGIRLGLSIMRGFRLAGVKTAAISHFEAARISLGLGPGARVALPAGTLDSFVGDENGERVEETRSSPVALDYGKILELAAASPEAFAASHASLEPIYVKPHYAEKPK